MAAGRPRKFDMEQALDQALDLFWKHGYEGTTLGELTEAMGINRPSLYAAFGNKESLFRRAIDRYIDRHTSELFEALEQPKLRRSVEHFLLASIDAITAPKNPHGCFLVQSAQACGVSAESARRETANRRAASELAFRRRFERAIAEGELPPGTNAADWAKYLAVVLQGLSVQAAGGATRAELKPVVELALRNWPA